AFRIGAVHTRGRSKEALERTHLCRLDPGQVNSPSHKTRPAMNLVAGHRAIAAAHAKIHVHNEQVGCIDKPRLYKALLSLQNLLPHRRLVSIDRRLHNRRGELLQSREQCRSKVLAQPRLQAYLQYIEPAKRGRSVDVFRHAVFETKTIALPQKVSHFLSFRPLAAPHPTLKNEK